MRLLVIDDESPSRRELAYLLRERLSDVIIDEAENGLDTFDLMANNQYDAAFVDIHLGDMMGTQLAQTLKKLQPGLHIIFATAYSDYAVKAFELESLDYIMKPFDPKRVGKAVEKLEKAIEESSSLQQSKTSTTALESMSKRHLPLLVDRRIVFVSMKDITHIESKGKECLIHTSNRTYESNSPLYYFEEKLTPFLFFRVHRSFLVNLEYVSSLEPWFNGSFCLKLRGFEGEPVPISRNQMKILRSSLNL